MSNRTKIVFAFVFGALTLCLPVIMANAAMNTSGNTVFSIGVNQSFDKEQGITYGRVVCLKHSGSHNGELLATCDQHMWVNGEQVWPIYRSKDNGANWTHITDVHDTVFGTNRKAQPMLYELPEAVGSLRAGTLILAGNLVPNDESSSRIVLYKSIDQGATWSYLSTVDQGGPFEYDRSPSSKTSTIWEPFVYMDAQKHLVCAFSDERQKNKGALQTLSLRYSSDGIHWGEEKNIVAINNKNDRPGMVTVSQLPNGRYIASYEVVNRPSYQQNSSVVYYKFSDDGIHWDETDLGILAKTADGQSLGSSPYIKWVNAGGPNGMVVIGAKWVVNANGDIQEGGQNLFVNYNLGEGNWERMPQPLTWNGEDITYLDAFSQCLETTEDDSNLLQIANIGSAVNKTCSLKIGVMPLTMEFYEAENATLSHVTVIDCEDASNKKEVGNINYSDSKVTFSHVIVPVKGTYRIYVRYNNGTKLTSTQRITVNAEKRQSIQYVPTPNWHQYGWACVDVYLNTGTNTISIEYENGYAEVDCIAIQKNRLDLSRNFRIKNRSSNKYLEIPAMSTALGTPASQFEKTMFPCQIWNLTGSAGDLRVINKNSFRSLGIKDNSSADGALVIQQKGGSTEKWKMVSTDKGFFNVVNSRTGKYLEVKNNSKENGAVIDQWEKTGYPCQEWTIEKEGIQ